MSASHSPARERVVMLTTSYPSAPGDASGHFVRAEALALAAAGHDVHVIAPGAPSRALADPGVHVERVGGAGLFGWPGALARAAERPLRLVAAPPFVRRAGDALAAAGPAHRVIAHFLVPSAWPVALRSLAPLEAVAHGSDVRVVAALPARMRARIVATLLDRGATFRFAAARSRDTLLGALAATLAARLAGASRVAPPTIELPDVTARAATLRAEALAELPRPLWVTCARLVPGKRVDRALVAARRAGASLVVVGDGPEGARLARLAEDLRVRARFVGRVPRDEALAWIAAADRLVHLSDAEGAPTVVREARALGVPVLASAAGDVPAWAASDPGIEIAREAVDRRAALDVGSARRSHGRVRGEPAPRGDVP